MYFQKLLYAAILCFHIVSVNAFINNHAASQISMFEEMFFHHSGPFQLTKSIVPLLAVTESKLNQQKPLKDSTIESFFGPKSVFSSLGLGSRSRHAEVDSKDMKKVIMAPKRRSRLSTPKSPIAANHNKTLLNSSSTASINRNMRHVRLRRAPASVQNLHTETPELSVSDDERSSMSYVATSTAGSDGFSETASTTDTETPNQSGEEEDVSDEDIVVPVSGQKRQKTLKSSPARKRIKRSGKICCSFSPVQIILLINHERSGSRRHDGRS